MNLKVCKTEFFFYQQYLCEYEEDFCSREMILTTRTGAGESTGNQGFRHKGPGFKTRSCQNRPSAAPSPNATSGVSPRLSEAATGYSGAGSGSPGMWGRERVPGPPRSRVRKAGGSSTLGAPPRPHGEDLPVPRGSPGGSSRVTPEPPVRPPAAVSRRRRRRAPREGLPTPCQRGAHGSRTMSPAGRAASGRASGRPGAAAPSPHGSSRPADTHTHTPSPAAARASASPASLLPAAAPRPRTPRRPVRPAHRLLPQPGAPLAAAGARLEDQPPAPPHNMASLGFRNGAREIQQGPLNIHERLGGGGGKPARPELRGGREGASEEAEARDADVHRAGRPRA